MVKLAGTPSMIKLLNKDMIEEIIRTRGPMTQPEIARLTKLSLVTVNKTVEMLCEEKKVKLCGTSQSTGGRRARYYEYNEDLDYYVGLFFYQDHYIGAIANSVGNIIERRTFPLRTTSEAETMDDTFRAIDALLTQCAGHAIAGIGVGVPGVVKAGVVSNIPNISGLEGVDLLGALSLRYAVPVLIENDMNLAALGVYFSTYLGKVNNLVLIYLEQGIGAGMILDRKLFKGATNFAGELSFLPARDPASGEAARSRYQGAFENRVAVLREQLQNSDAEERALCKERLLHALAEGILCVACIVNPEVVVVDCSAFDDGDMRAMREILRRQIDAENIPDLVRAEDLKSHSLRGMFKLCVEEMHTAYSLSNRRRG